MNTLKPGNIGVITTRDDSIMYEITGIQNGLVYCLPLTGPRIVAICLPDQFWALLEYMP